MKATIVFYLFLLILKTTIQEERVAPIIDTKDGRVSGTIEKSFSGQDYLAYYGIHFAEPPIGSLRFKVSIIFPKRLIFLSPFLQ